MCIDMSLCMRSVKCAEVCSDKCTEGRMRAAWCAVGTGVEVVGVKLGRAVGVGVRQSAPGKLISCLFLAHIRMFFRHSCRRMSGCVRWHCGQWHLQSLGSVELKKQCADIRTGPWSLAGQAKPDIGRYTDCHFLYSNHKTGTPRGYRGRQRKKGPRSMSAPYKKKLALRPGGSSELGVC